MEEVRLKETVRTFNKLKDNGVEHLDKGERGCLFGIDHAANHPLHYMKKNLVK